MQRSEKLARVAQAAWEIRHAAGPVPPGVRAWTDQAGADVDPAALAAVVDLLDEVAVDWHALPVGGSLVLEWP
jgi:hypothetical protein